LWIKRFIVQPIEVLFLLSHGKKQKRLFKTESGLAEYLTATHTTEAPIRFSYSDGSCVQARTLDRVYARIFKARGLEETPPLQAAGPVGATLLKS
jgi:hypothetical protein